MRLHVLAILATALASAGAAATPTAALQPMAAPTPSSLVTRVADFDRPAARHHRRAHIHRYRRGHGHWRRVVITAGHRLHYFPGEIVYTYFPGDVRCCYYGR